MMKKMWAEYRDFISQGDVITIAVGLVVALFFKDIVDAFVDGIIMPIVSLVTGQASFGDIDFTLGEATFEIGLVIRAALIFLIVVFVLYLIIKLYNTHFVKPEPAVVADTELAVLQQIRDELRRSQGGTPPPPPPTV